MGFAGQEHWSGLPCPPPGDLPDPEIELSYSVSPALLPAELSVKPPRPALYSPRAECQQP